MFILNLLCMCFCTIPSNSHTSLSTALVLILCQIIEMVYSSGIFCCLKNVSLNRDIGTFNSSVTLMKKRTF